MRRAARLRVLLAGLIAVAVGIAVYLAGGLTALERDSVALRFALRDVPPPSEIVVVAVDDATFSEPRQRQWPFPRSMHARVIDRLHRAGAREIVYDVQFTERTREREDLALYEALERAG